MPTFQYKAKKGPEEIIEGAIEAEGFDSAVQKLIRNGLVPLEVVPAGAGDKASFFKGKSGTALGGVRLKSTEVVAFTRQLCDLLDAGVPILRALSIIASQSRNPRLSAVVSKIRDFVQDGGSLAGALGQYPNIFSRFYVNMVKSGEVSGQLEVVLNRLAEMVEKDYEIRAKVTSSLVYPFLVLAVGAGMVVILLTVVMPKLMLIFEDLNQELPLLTTVVIGTSQFFLNFWWAILGGLAAIGFYIYKFLQSEQGRWQVDRWRLRIPVLGPFIKDVEVGRFARTLSTLLASGVSIVASLESVSAVLNNEVLCREIEKISDEVASGANLSDSLRGCSFFPETAINMVVVGEESGKLPQSLQKLADSYERQTERALKTVIALLEPLMIIVVSVVVGVIVVAMLLPIFQMNLGV